MEQRAKPIVLCPLVIEQRALLRSGVAAKCDIECCGPGVAGIQQWFRRNVRDRPVVLAGLAGGVKATVKSGAAYVISCVIAEDARRWTPTWPNDMAREALTATIACTDAALTTPQEKRAFGERTGADLVDLESAAFAEAAEAAGVPWAIVRGVSDDAAMALPPGVDRWVDERGRTRVMRVAAAVARRPWIVRDLLQLQRASNAALLAVAACLRKFLKCEEWPE